MSKNIPQFYTHFSKNMSRKDRRRFGKAEDATNILERFLLQLGKPEQRMLTRLWEHWEMVMGPEISSIACPLGQKDGVLFVGGEDTMSVQELSYMHDEILERANTFMNSNFFVRVKVRLALDKNPLHIISARLETKRVHTEFGPPLSGKYLKDMDPDSAVAKCYARFVAFNNEKKY